LFRARCHSGKCWPNKIRLPVYFPPGPCKRAECGPPEVLMKPSVENENSLPEICPEAPLSGPPCAARNPEGGVLGVGGVEKALASPPPPPTPDLVSSTPLSPPFSYARVHERGRPVSRCFANEESLLPPAPWDVRPRAVPRAAGALHEIPMLPPRGPGAPPAVRNRFPAISRCRCSLPPHGSFSSLNLPFALPPCPFLLFFFPELCSLVHRPVLRQRCPILDQNEPG